MPDIKPIINFFNTNDKKKITIIISLFLIGALFESISVGLILPIFSILIGGKDSLLNSELFIKFSPDFIIKILENNSEQTILFSSLIIITVVYFIKNFYLSGSYYLAYKIIYQFQADISDNLFKKYLSLPYNFFLNSNKAVLVRNVQDEVGTFVRRLLVPGLLLVSEILTISFLFVILVSANPLASIIATTFAIFFGLFVFFTRPKIKKWGIQRANYLGKKYKNLYESFNSIVEIKIRSAEEKFLNLFKQNNSIHILADRNVDLFNIFPRFLLEFFGVLLFSSIIALLFLFGYNSEKILPIMALYAAAAFRILPSINRVLVYYNSFLYGQKAFEKINTEFSNDYSNFSKNKKKLESEIIKKIKFENLELKDVSFAYDKTQAVLKDINLNIKKGTYVGIQGQSGSGKSTLVLLITGLLKPTSGKIFLNQTHDTSEKQKILNSLIGYVSQKTTLFDDTIKKNIALGEDENEIDETKLKKVIEITQLKDFIYNLKDGIETVVGDDGLRISGGQRQRIAIARALYFNPDLLIMDEATSSLDKDIEDKIIEIIKNLKGKKTLVFISHKLSNLNICDEKFEVVNSGIRKI